MRILVKDIIYVEGYGEYLRIYLEGQAKPLVVYMRMKEMEEQLADKCFMHIHKSYIINLHHLVEIDKKMYYS